MDIINYEVKNTDNECIIKLTNEQVTINYTIIKSFGYTKKFYNKLFKDISEYNQGLYYGNNETIITCNNGNLYFVINSPELGYKCDIVISHDISKKIIKDVINVL